MKDIQIIATIGPSSLNSHTLKTFKERGVNVIRVNLSHTREEEIENVLKQMKTSGITVAIDTEGCQIRTGSLGRGQITFFEGDKVKVFNHPVICSKSKLYIRPKEALSFLEVGSLISIDFNSVLLKVTDITHLDEEHFVKCVVVTGGVVGNNKAVSIDALSQLPAFSQKDLYAIEIAKKLKVTFFTLSFIKSAQNMKEFRKLYPKATAIAKIETRKGVENFDEILKNSDGILIDRGDLSREIAQERIPITQKIIIKKCNQAKKPVYVATNVLESMSENLKPMKSEINDVVNTILDGVNGFLLTKESAVGKYPIETVNTLKGLIAHVESAMKANKSKSFEELSYTTDSHLKGNLIEPHGGTLVNRYQIVHFSDGELAAMQQVNINDELLMDVELIATGVYSPLEGFMNEETIMSVLDKMRLPNGLPWTMPIIFPIDEKIAKKVKPRETIALIRENDHKAYGTLLVESVFSVNKEEICQKWFGTINPEHPGVRNVMNMSSYFLSGKINLLHRRPSEYKDYELMPSQTRQIFQEKGWSVIVGFHTRNPIHRSHEFIQLNAMERVQADGLFVHPVVGKKKKGDFEAHIIIKAYELMMKKFYPKGKVVMGVYATYSRYAGPREAIFTALCRKNYGCTHFVVGRDHTGVGNFYAPTASHEIFKKFPDLGIVPVIFNQVYYSPKAKKHVQEISEAKVPEHEQIKISGTQIRQMFLSGEKPPEWFMRPEIANMILAETKTARRVFVP